MNAISLGKSLKTPIWKDLTNVFSIIQHAIVDVVVFYADIGQHPVTFGRRKDFWLSIQMVTAILEREPVWKDTL